jgi:hypothetical protein
MVLLSYQGLMGHLPELIPGRQSPRCPRRGQRLPDHPHPDLGGARRRRPALLLAGERDRPEPVGVSAAG